MRSGFKFTPYQAPEESVFDKLFDIFKELIVHTSGDFDEAIDWLRELDMEYKLTTRDYTIEDFIEDLKRKGYIREAVEGGGGGTTLTGKMERVIRQSALEQIFGNMKRSGAGNHNTAYTGMGDEHTGEFRGFRFGDPLEQISMTESFRNAQIAHGVDSFQIDENDLVVEDTFH